MKTSRIAAVAQKLAVFIVVLCMACIAPLTALAAETNEAVRDDTTGVVQVKLVYIDPNTQMESDIQSGTGFLINDSTVITCNHVVSIDAPTMELAMQAFGVDRNTVLNNSVIKISVLRDIAIEATVQNASAEMDYAILNLSSQLYDRTYLPIRSSATVQQTEEAFALGFPGETRYFQDVNTYTSDDVTIASGRVNKINTVDGVDYIQTSTQFSSGNSGGPLVDANGAVIGICQGITTDNFDQNYYYAIAIDQLTRSLDSLGVEYTSVDGASAVPAEEPAEQSGEQASAAETTPEATPAPSVDKTSLSALVSDVETLDMSLYTKDSADALTQALTNAQDVLANDAAAQEDVDAAEADLNDAFVALETSGGNTTLIVIAIVAAVVIVVVIVVVIILAGKKKKKPADNAYEYAQKPAPQPPIQPNKPNHPNNPPAGGFAPVNPVPPTVPVRHPNSGSSETSVLNQGAGETTVLNQGSSETTVLKQNVNYGTLTRKKNGETIKINSPQFTVGKERAKVSYCVADNTSVSRTHAQIINRGGMAYLADLNATNGTFLNGVRLNPRQESALKNGDVILLADEEFVFHI